MLIGAPLAGAAHAGLDLIDDEQRAGGVGESAGFCEELLGEGTNAALALNGFNKNGADLGGEFGAQIGYVVEADEVHAGNDGCEGLAVLILIGGGDGTEGAAVKALLEGEELCADADAFTALEAGVGAGQLHGALPCFRAGVGEKGAVKAGLFGEAQGELRLALVEVEVRGVDERAALAGDGFNNDRVIVAEGVDADAAEQVEVLRTVLVNDVNTLTRHEENGVAVVGGDEQPGFSGANLIEFIQFHFSWSICPADR